MILENGYLQAVTTSGGGMAHGKPVPVTQTLGERVACNIRTITHDHRGKLIDGSFTQASYEVLVDISTAKRFTADQIALTDNREGKLGTFRVQDVQHLDFVGAIKITV